MPRKLEKFPPNWDEIRDQCPYAPLNCPRTITSEEKTLTVVIMWLKWTFNFNLWITVTAHPEEKPNISKIIGINKHHPLLASLSEALNDYEDFPEPHLSSYQFQIHGEPLDSLFGKYSSHNGQYSPCLS